MNSYSNPSIKTDKSWASLVEVGYKGLLLCLFALPPNSSVEFINTINCSIEWRVNSSRAPGVPDDLAPVTFLPWSHTRASHLHLPQFPTVLLHPAMPLGCVACQSLHSFISPHPLLSEELMPIHSLRLPLWSRLWTPGVGSCSVFQMPIALCSGFYLYAELLHKSYLHASFPL